MAKNKRDKRATRDLPQQDKVICSLRVDLRTGEVTTVTLPAGPLDVHARYLEHHELIPEDLEAWSAAELRREVTLLERRGFLPDWEKALMLLAHHRSEIAIELLVELKNCLLTLHTIPRNQ